MFDSFGSMVGGALGGIGGFLLGGPAGALAGGLGGWGLGQQFDAYNWNRQAFEQSRWDAAHAVQTRAVDLEAAGMSPLLAAGSSAQVMSSPQLQAPLDAGKMVELTNGIQQVKKTAAETDYIRAQTDKVNVDKQSVQQAVDYSKLANPLLVRSLAARATSDEAKSALDVLDKAIAFSVPTGAGGRMNPDGSSGFPLDAGGFVNLSQTLRGEIAGLQVETQKYSPDAARAQLTATLLAIKKSGLEYKILEQASKLDPGTAQSLKQWFGVIGEGLALGKALF